MFYKKRINKKNTESPDETNPQVDTSESQDLEIQYCTRTDEGMVRKNNEDSLCFIKPNEAKELQKKGILAIVADGMGGHAGGEVASRIAVDTISSNYYKSSSKSIVDALANSVLEANSKILKTAQKDSILKGMGTTVTSLVIKDDLAYFAHVGDSRLYHWRNGILNQISTDHTLVQQMVEKGDISHFEAANHSQKNVLLQALGTKPKVDVLKGQIPLNLKLGDRFLLCSDGLTDLVKDIEIKQIMEMSSIYMVASCLIALAKDKGGHDNVSVVILQAVAATSKDDQRITRDIN